MREQPTVPDNGMNSTTKTTTTEAIAAGSIPAGVEIGPVEIGADFGAETFDQRQTSVSQRVVYQDGKIRPIDEAKRSPATTEWTVCIRTARDRYEQNTEAFMDDGKLKFRTIRTIRPGETLLAWYSDHLAILAEIPTLTPSHIQGNQKYVCLSCGANFHYPNPLKAHIRYHCKRAKRTPHESASPASWWQMLHPTAAASLLGRNPLLTLSAAGLDPRLHQLGLLQALPHWADAPNIAVPAPGVTLLTAATSLLRQHEEDLRRIHHHHYHHNLHHNHRRQQADSPFSNNRRLPSNGSSATASPPTSQMTPSPPASTTQPYQPAANLPLTKSEEPIDMIPQSLYMDRSQHGKGHLCIYCGKLYSRKYGLKIHLRTHTGYKPLQCRVCHRPFGDPSNLNKHVRLHQNSLSSGGGGGGAPTPYKCQLCGKVLVRRRDLERHVKSRHPNHNNNNNSGSGSSISPAGSDKHVVHEDEEEEELMVD